MTQRRRGPHLFAEVTPELHIAVKRQALEERRSVSDLVRDSVRAYLVQIEKKNGKRKSA